MRARPPAGFTLLELMVTTALVVALSTGAVLIMRNVRPSIRLAEVSREMQLRLQEARTRSLVEQISYGIKFDEWNQTYQLVRVAGGTTVVESYELPKDFYFSDGLPFLVDAIVFDSIGAPSASGSIQLEYTSGRHVHVYVAPSGYIYIE